MCWFGKNFLNRLPAGFPRDFLLGAANPLVSGGQTAYDGALGRSGGSRFGNPRRRAIRAGAILSVDDSPLTRASLLVQLRDGANHGAWREFMQLYGPVIYGFARKRGLQDADAADLMQDVMRSVTGAIGRLDYDRNQGSFRGWLFTITRNKIFNFLSARRIRPQGSSDTTTNQLLETQSDTTDSSADWDLEYQRRLATLAMDRIRSEFQDSTWQAFQLTAVEGIAASTAAQQTGLSTGAIYVAKSRVLARLKTEVETLRRQEDA